MNVVHLLKDYAGREGMTWCGRGGIYSGKDANLFCFEFRYSDGGVGEVLGTTAMCEVTCTTCINIGTRIRRMNIDVPRAPR